MPFHAERFSNCFSTITGKEVAEVLSINVAAYDSINSPGKRAKFIKLLMEELTQKLPASETAQVMQSCGMQ